MKPLFLLVVLSAFAVLAACAPVTTPIATPGPARSQTLHLEVPSDGNMSDIPRLMAVDALRAQGYTVETVDFGDNALSVQALEQGNLDLAYVGNGVAWNAIQKGAKIVTILDDVSDTRVLAVAPGIVKCQDLNGKRVAIPSTGSSQAITVNAYVENTCPDAKIELIVIASPSNRYIALSTGQVDAATMNLTDLIGANLINQNNVDILEEFSEQYTHLRGGGQVTRRELIEQNPETVKDIVRELLLARRKVQDLDVLTENAVKYLKMDPAQARELGKTYLERNIWNVNGGWTPENLQVNLDFFVESGSVPEGLTVAQIADLSIVNQVLEEIGRK